MKLVTIKNDFHNTRARVRYPGGVHPIPRSALKKLCPWHHCLCIPRLGGLHALYKDQGVEVTYSYDLGWVLYPADAPPPNSWAWIPAAELPPR